MTLTDHTAAAASIAQLIAAMRVDSRIEAAAFGELDPPIGWLYWIGDETVVIRQDLAGVDPEENSQFLRQNTADIYLPALRRRLDQAGVAFSEELAGPGWLAE